MGTQSSMTSSALSISGIGGSVENLRDRADMTLIPLGAIAEFVARDGSCGTRRLPFPPLRGDEAAASLRDGDVGTNSGGILGGGHGRASLLAGGRFGRVGEARTVSFCPFAAPRAYRAGGGTGAQP